MSAALSLSSSDAGTIILLPFMAVPSMVAISCLNDQYGRSYFCTSAFVNSHPWSTSSVRMLQCLSSRVAVLIYSDVMQSVLSMHDYNALMIMHMPGISPSLFHSCVWIANL